MELDEHIGEDLMDTAIILLGTVEACHDEY